jgi:hypothetical protein
MSEIHLRPSVRVNSRNCPNADESGYMSQMSTPTNAAAAKNVTIQSNRDIGRS